MRRSLFHSRDSVCVSTSGYALLVDNPIEVEILPLATLIVPNKSEAEPVLFAQREGLDPEPGGFCLYIEGASHLWFESGLDEGQTSDENDDGDPRAAGGESCKPGAQVRAFGQGCEYSPSWIY